MKILEGLVLRPLGGDFIVTGDGIARIDFSKVVSMNATADYLFKELKEREFTAEDMARLLTDRYDVSAETALADARTLAASWQDAGLLAE